MAKLDKAVKAWKSKVKSGKGKLTAAQEVKTEQGVSLADLEAELKARGLM
jgi:hypothetical protein